MDADLARRLADARSRALLDTLPPYDSGTAESTGATLREAGVDVDLVAALLTQSRLRARAQAKLGDFAAGMLLTPEGLEQATRWPVAALHAQRYRAAGIREVLDMTCGIGVDAMAFASLGLAVTACEIDEATAIIADHNLRHWSGAQVVHGDGLELARRLSPAAVFADPARRNARGRRHDPGDYQPRLDDVLTVREHIPAVGIKVGPAIPHAALPNDVEAQWISVDGTVVEAGLWSGPLATTAAHTALMLRGGRAVSLTGTTSPAPVAPLQEYLYEPDGAIIRAGLVGEVAGRLNAGVVAPRIAYLTSDAVVDTPFARGYRIIEQLPLKTARLAAALRERGIGSVDIKKRGVDITPEQLRPALRLRGDSPATLILTPVGSKRVALLVEPLP